MMIMTPADFLKHFMINFNDTPGRETFVFKVDKKDQHYTIQIRHRERMLDVHLTRELIGGTKEYTTLYQASFHQISRFLVKTRHLVRGITQELDRSNDPLEYFGIVSVNLGWFRRSFMSAMPGDMKKLEQVGLLRFQNRGMRIRMAREVLSIDPETILMPIDQGMNRGLYIVQRSTKRGSMIFAGFLLVLPLDQRKRFLYLSKNRLNRLITDQGRKAFEEELSGKTHGVTGLPMPFFQRFAKR
jgi:hypothetical protein